MKIEFLKPGIREADIRRMVKSVKTGWLVRGPYTRELEAGLNRFLGNTSLVTSSCTASMHMALILAGVKKGDEVITTPMSWVATDFIYYGTRQIRLVKDGFETLTVLQPIPAPWYQVFPIDFFAENVVPISDCDSVVGSPVMPGME